MPFQEGISEHLSKTCPPSRKSYPYYLPTVFTQAAGFGSRRLPCKRLLPIGFALLALDIAAEQGENRGGALCREGSTPRGHDLRIGQDSVLNSLPVPKISARGLSARTQWSNKWRAGHAVCIRRKLQRNFPVKAPGVFVLKTPGALLLFLMPLAESVE